MKMTKEKKSLLVTFALQGISFDFENLEKGLFPCLLDGFTYFITEDGRQYLQELIDCFTDGDSLLANEAQSFILKYAIQIKLNESAKDDIFVELEKAIDNSKVDNRVVLPIIGIDVEAPFKIGCFTIIKKEKLIAEAEPKFEERMIKHLERCFGQFVAIGDVYGNPASAIRIGKDRFEFELARFKAFLPLICRGDMKPWIACLSTDVVLSDSALILNSKGTLANSEIKTHPIGLEIDKKIKPELKSIREFLDTISFNKLISYSNRKSKYENAINMAFWWLGKQFDEPSKEINLLYSVFALEKLLSNSTSFSSITAAVSEKCAFLIGTSKDERIKIFERAKSLYSIRSGLAHGSSSEISLKDVNEAYQLALTVLLKVIELNESQNFTDISSLDKYLNEIKYR